jgi:hypothetical protein
MIGGCGTAGSAPVAVPIIKTVGSLPPCNGTGDFLYRITSITEVGGAPLASEVYMEWTSCQGVAHILFAGGSNYQGDSCAFCVAGSVQLKFSRDVTIATATYSGATQGCSNCNSFEGLFEDSTQYSEDYQGTSFFVNNTNNAQRLRIGYFDTGPSNTYIEYSSWNGIGGNVYFQPVNPNCWICVAPQSTVFQWKDTTSGGDILEVIDDASCGCYPPQIFNNPIGNMTVGTSI